jgi:hypothetical protein
LLEAQHVPQALALRPISAPATLYRIEDRARSRSRIFAQRVFQLGWQGSKLCHVSPAYFGQAKLRHRRET